MAEESKTAVIAAMGANFAIAVGKLAAGIITGSAALLAEAGHSIADTVNQVFLLVGLRLSKAEADSQHPHGRGKEGFFWSFLAAVFIFVAGSVFSIYEGVRTLIQESDHHRTGTELAIAFGVLGMAFVFESFSFVFAVRGVQAGARDRGWTLMRFLRRAPDPTSKTVFYEDSAALVGLVFAAGGLALSELTHTETWDAIASLLIGVLLAGVALILGMQSRRLLLGSAASDDTQAAIHATIGRFPEVERVVRMLTMQIGAHSVLVTGELQVERGLSTEAIEDLIGRIDARLGVDVPEVSDTFWELRRAPGVAAATPGSSDPRPAAS